MDSKRIEELLEKYWACETSIVEERELRAYFKSGDVSTNLKETASLFQYYEIEHNQKKLGTDFDVEVLTKLDQSNNSTKVIQWFNNYAKVAAVILVVIALSMLVTRTIQQQDNAIQLADTYENPEDAFEETKKALLLISQKIGKGKAQMVKLSEFSKTEEKIKNKEVEL